MKTGSATSAPSPTSRQLFPFKEDGIDYAGVMKILEESGIGLPPYLKWGRTHSGCYFCFFQRSIEWVRLLETHPDQFEEAMATRRSATNQARRLLGIRKCRCVN